jgi:hypothetical protein
LLKILIENIKEDFIKTVVDYNNGEEFLDCRHY